MSDSLSIITHPYSYYTLLGALDTKILEQCITNGTMSISHYSKNEVIHFDGEICTHLEIVLEGKVTVDRIDVSGNILTITEFYPDEMIGGNLIFSSTPYYPMTVSASETSTIFRISKNTVFELCMTNRTFLKAYLEDISNHTLLLGDKIKHAIKRSIRESLSAYLLQESLIQKSRIIKLKITKKALADRFGVQRTSISRELQKMKNDGLIDYDSKTITLINL